MEVVDDQSVRRGTTPEQLAALEPAFLPKIGTITAATSAPLSDGAAAIVVMSLAEARRQGLEPLARVVGTAVVGAALMLVTGMSPWVWPSVLWLLPIGVLAALGQLCMTNAYSRGSTLVVANLQYSGIVFGALFGLILFGDHIPLMGWLGMALIMASGIASTVLRNRTLPSAPAEDH